MNIKTLSNMVLEVRTNHTKGDEVKEFLLVSDVHLDHPYCNRELFFSLLDEAVKRNAPILINGDLLCLMQGKRDRRGSKSSIRPQHNAHDYFNKVVKETADLLAPYAKNIILMGDGNHETAIIRHQEVDVLGWLVHRLNADHGGNIHRFGYHSFVRFVLQSKKAANVRAKIMYRHHGKYGGIVSKGSQAVARHGLVIPQADIVWTGHTHDLHTIYQPRLLVKATGETFIEDALHIRTGTFKDEFNQPGGFGVEKIATPKSMGGYWLKMKTAGKKQVVKVWTEVAR